MIERPSSVTILVLCVLACAAGAAAVLMAGSGFDVDQDLSTQDRIMERPSSDPLMITEAHWQPEPHLFADFNLQLDVDLSDGAELDLLVRRVEPRPVDGERLPFQGRFTVLRISAGKEPPGPGWRTREQALFEPGGGAHIDAGAPATIWVEGRGRTLTGNVAGVKLSSFAAADEQGSFVLLVRSGKAAVHRLMITNLGRPAGVPAWLLGAGLGLLLCGLGWLRGVRGASLLVSLPLLPAGALLGRAIVFDGLLPLAVPATASVLLAAFCCGPLLLVDWLPGARGAGRLLGWLRIAVALLLVVALLEAGTRNEDVRRRGSEHPALELVFGKGAGEGLAEALAGRVRGPRAIHVPDRERPPVMLLGGKLMWSPEEPDRGADVLLEGEMVKRGQKVEVMAVPTADGYGQQQWLQYDLFFRRLHPAVLVFGVPAQEDAEEPGGSATERLQRCADWRDHRLRLLPFAAPRGLLHRSAPPRGHRTNRLELRAILQRVRADCDASGVRLVLAAGPTLPVAFREELRVVERTGTPLFELSSGESTEAMVERLAGVIAPLLAK